MTRSNPQQAPAAPAQQQMQPQQQRQRFSVAIATKPYQDLIHNTLSDPAHIQRFTASITSAVSASPVLQECDPGTVLSCALLGESLGLSPSPQLGQYYMVPFDCKVKGKDGKPIYIFDEKGEHVLDRNKRWAVLTVKKAQFVLGYKGLLQMALRSGCYASMDVMEIHEGEYLGRDEHTGAPRFRYIVDDDVRDSAPVTGYMAYLKYTTGFEKTIYWSRKKMLGHADKYSAAFSAEAYEKIQRGEIPDNEMWRYSSHWYTDFDAMAKKTMLRQLISKWGVMTTELAQAFEKDTVDVEGHTIQTEEIPDSSAPALGAPAQFEMPDLSYADRQADPVPATTGADQPEEFEEFRFDQ